MNCKTCGGERLSAYIVGMLDGDRLRQVASHIDECESCRSQYKEMLKLRSVLRTMGAPSVPSRDQFWADAYRAARLASPRRTLEPRASSLRGLYARYAALAACVFFVGGTALVTSNMPSGNSTQSPRGSVTSDASVVDIGDLVQAHADTVAGQPLPDRPRATMVTSEIVSQNSTSGILGDTGDATSTEPAVNAATGLD